MKLVVVSICAAVAVTLGACSHMTDTASLPAAPVASLTADEIRAELVDVSEELDLVRSLSREAIARENNQRRMAMLASRHSDSSVVGPLEPQVIPVTPPYVKIERLLRRRDELRAQLARVSPPQS